MKSVAWLLVFIFIGGTFGAPSNMIISQSNHSLALFDLNRGLDLSPYEKVTKSKKGCSCWFDPLEKFTKSGECACCKWKKGVQCGYPMHNYCQPIVAKGEVQQGCIGQSLIINTVSNDPIKLHLYTGIKKNKQTLTEKGGYCHYSTTKKGAWDCAVCTPDAIQCGPYVDLPYKKYEEGQYCYRGGSDSKCFGRSKTQIACGF